MKIDRLFSIILLLLAKNKLTARQLAEQLEVTVRTIYRDVEALSQAGVPIVTSSGPQGGIAIMDKFKLNSAFFNPTDLAMLLNGLSTVSGFANINHTLIKIQSLIPKEQQAKIEAQANNTLIDLQPWFIADDTASEINTLKLALSGRYLVHFRYRNRDGLLSERDVEPYQLMFKQGNWYLRGYCLTKQDWRLFKISRLMDLALSQQQYTVRDLPPAKAIDQCWCQVDIITIKLLIDAEIIEQVREYTGRYRVEALPSGQYLVDYPFIEDEWSYQQLLSYGDKCQCLEPHHIRQELIHRLQRTLQRYQ